MLQTKSAKMRSVPRLPKKARTATSGLVRLLLSWKALEVSIQMHDSSSSNCEILKKFLHYLNAYYLTKLSQHVSTLFAITGKLKLRKQQRRRRKFKKTQF